MAKRYHPLLITLHWTVFVLVIAAFGVIELKGQFTKGSEPRELCKNIHGLIGQFIFIAMVLRLIVRARFGAPPPHKPQQLFAILAKMMHWLLYALLIALPIMGVVFLQAGGKEVHFFSLVWPEIISPNPGLKKLFKELHEFLGNALYFLIGIHAMAALWQHYVLKDDTLRRMLNKTRA